jgi:hypothetical protein
MTSKLSWLAVLAFVAVLGFAAVQTADAARLRANLTGTSAASGKAQWESRADRVRLSVEVEDVALPNGTVLTVTACGASVGTITLALGEGDLNLDTRDGQSVPTCSNGSSVTVSNGAATVVSGNF